MTAPTMTREERAAQVKEIHDGLAEKLAAFTTTEQWTDYLATAAKFHRYSPFNVLWLQLQAAEREMDLSNVAGFRAWQKLKRQVRKGETSLKVLAPSRYKVEDEKTGEDRWVVRGFTMASVFDVSQTDGDPLPVMQPALLVDGGEQAVLDAIHDLIRAEGFTVVTKSQADMGGANGQTYWTPREVAYRDDVELAQAIKTSVHELAHVLLHDPDAPTPRRMERERMEVEAESVAYIVLTHLGITADDYSLPYVAAWSKGDGEAVQSTAQAVVATAHKVIEALDAEHGAVCAA